MRCALLRPRVILSLECASSKRPPIMPEFVGRIFVAVATSSTGPIEWRCYSAIVQVLTGTTKNEGLSGPSQNKTIPQPSRVTLTHGRTRVRTVRMPETFRERAECRLHKEIRNAVLGQVTKERRRDVHCVCWSRFGFKHTNEKRKALNRKPLENRLQEPLAHVLTELLRLRGPYDGALKRIQQARPLSAFGLMPKT